MLRDGYMETGDVMEQRGPNTVVWIDRKKNIMKLAQGEFVSISRLEVAYSGNSDLINQMYIYGSGLRSYLLAAVVPSEGELLKSLILLWALWGIWEALRSCPFCRHAQASAPVRPFCAWVYHA